MRRSGTALIAGALALAGSAALAETRSEGVQKQIQMHEKIARAHLRVADCLKSGKSESECRVQEMGHCTSQGIDAKSCSEIIALKPEETLKSEASKKTG